MAEDIERVTPAQIESLRKSFQDKIVATNADFCPEDLERVKMDNLWMRRFIAAQENDVTKATEMLYETCQWRKEFGTNELDHTKLNPRMLEKGVLFIRNKDKWGKNLLVFKAKFHNKGVEDIEDLKKFIVYFFERIERVSESDQISVIFDMKDTGWSNMDMDFIRYLITLLKQYYPYFVNYLMIFEMPWLLKSAWNIIKGWLPPKFVDRVKFVDKKSILEFIDEKNQLTSWGGQDNYTYSFEAEVRQTKVRPTSGGSSDASPQVNGNGPTPPAIRQRKISNKVKFTDRDGTIDTTRIRITAMNNSPPPQPSPSRSRDTLQSVPPPPATPDAGDQHLLAEIDETIIFRQEANETVGRIRIASLTQTEPIIFKLKTTNPDKFRCRPTIGMMEAGMRAEITVTPYPDVVLSTIPNERFQIQVTIMPRYLLSGAETESESQSGASTARGIDFPRLNALYKSIATAPGKYVENHRLVCVLDPSVPLQNDVTSLAGPSVRMSEEDMRRGLANLENTMSASTRRIVEEKTNELQLYLYGILALLGVLLLLLIWVWWRMPVAGGGGPPFCPDPSGPAPIAPGPNSPPSPLEGRIIPPPITYVDFGCLET